MKRKLYFVLSTLTLCTIAIGINSFSYKQSSNSNNQANICVSNSDSNLTNNSSFFNNDLAIKINNINYKHQNIDFENGNGLYVSNPKATIDEKNNSIRFISAVKVEINDNKEITLPGRFGFHISYNKLIDSVSTKINKMYDVDALYYSYSETNEKDERTIYGSELSSYYNNHEGSTFKTIQEYVEDDSNIYNLFMTVEIRNIPTAELDSSIALQPYCLLDNGSYDLAKKIEYYSFNAMKNTTPKIEINNFKVESLDNIPYFIINSSLKNISYKQLYLVFELQEGWPHATYNLTIDKVKINEDDSTDLYINLDQTINDSSLKNGEYTISIKNTINDEQINLSNSTDNMFKDKIVSQNRSIYQFGEKYGNLKVDVIKYDESQIINNSYRIEVKEDKDYLVINSYLFIEDISALKINVTKFTNWSSEDKTCTYSLLKDGSYDIFLDITNFEFDSKTSDNLYGGYFIKLVANNVSSDVKYDLQHENNIISGKYTFEDQWGNLKLHIVNTNTIEYNSYKIENVDNKAILTINANLNINDLNDLKFKFTKFKTGDWIDSYDDQYTIDKQSNGSFNISININELDICGKTSDNLNEGYLISLKTSDIDNDCIPLGTAPEAITIDGKTFSFEDLYGNLKIVISNVA